MSFDLKYRPQTFSDIVGQEGTVQVLKRLIQSGKVFEKSYIFAGPSGTGKTTTARILAKAMLCPNVDLDTAEPCNTCEQCRAISEGRSSFSFSEMDAANNSGVDQIRNMVEGLDYYTLDGKDRKIYLIDESHRLSTSGMDALLKPMEDAVPGSNDKRLVCLLCTTEPEKLRGTIKARCLTFGITEPSKENAIERLRYICEQEGITYTEEGLEVVFSAGQGHMRDVVSSLERVAMTGEVNEDNAREQLGLKTVTLYYHILSKLRDNLSEALDLVRIALRSVDAPTLYNGIAEAALFAYKASLGVSESSGYFDEKMALEIFSLYGPDVLWVSDRILGSSKRIDENVLLGELVILSRILNGGTFTVGSPVISSKPKADTMPETKAGDTNVDLAREYASDLSPLAKNFVNPNKDAKEEKVATTVEKVAPILQGEEIPRFAQSVLNDADELFDDD